MKTIESEIPLIQRAKIVSFKKTESQASSCCAPKTSGAACCTPSESKDENNGACCAQPEDGSACCDK